MKITIGLIIALVFSTASVFAELPEKNRSKDVPPTLTITRDEGKFGPTGASVPIIHSDKPVTKYAPRDKNQIEEDELKDVQVHIK